MSQISCQIGALWDADAKVWIAKSEDVPGLATEADTLEALTKKLRIIVPELLQLNQVIPDDQASTIAIELTSHRQEIIQVAA
ncbi:MAG: DUF1902 domain-containing protein [Symploca sp. SIO2E6]|nr:DUF1902 domain-containing protein [Symploca sp. SIO2E6]